MTITIDRDLLIRVLLDLRVSVDDGHTVVTDMMLPPQERELGPVLHRVQYREAHQKVIQTLTYLQRLAQGGSASPDGGGTPPH